MSATKTRRKGTKGASRNAKGALTVPAPRFVQHSVNYPVSQQLLDTWQVQATPGALVACPLCGNVLRVAKSDSKANCENRECGFYLSSDKYPDEVAGGSYFFNAGVAWSRLNRVAARAIAEGWPDWLRLIAFDIVMRLGMQGQGYINHRQVMRRTGCSRDRVKEGMPLLTEGGECKYCVFPTKSGHEDDRHERMQVRPGRITPIFRRLKYSPSDGSHPTMRYSRTTCFQFWMGDGTPEFTPQ